MATRIIQLAWIGLLIRKGATLLQRAARGLARWLPGVRLGGPAPSWLTPFRRHLISNLIVGLGIAVVLHQLHHAAYLTHLEDIAMDWAMAAHRGTLPPGKPLPIAFIDIDEASHRAWGEPLATPRGALATLIDHAVRGGAAAIVVDIDLSRPSGDPDRALAAVLARYLPGSAASGLPPIILARTQRGRLPEAGDALPEDRPSFLDPLVAAAPGIDWGAPVFDLDRDGKVRRWHLWEAVCGPDQQPRVLPSIQLQVKALMDGIPSQRAELAAQLRGLTPADCRGPAPEQTARGAHDGHQPQATDAHLGDDHHGHQTDYAGQAHHDASHHADHGHGPAVTLGVHAIQLSPHDAQRRILYRIPWQLREGEGRPLVPLDGARVPLLSTRPAAPLAAAGATADHGWLRGHLVFIGASHGDSRDLYQTPIGLMPGSLVLANATASLDAHGTLRTPGLWETLLVEGLLITLMSWLFARFDSFWGSVASGIAVILLLLPASLWLLGWGYWLSFAVPLLAVQAHQLIAELEESLTHRHPTEARHD